PVQGTFVWSGGRFFTNDVPGFGKIPEPTSWWLLGLGLMGVARVGRRIA
ncbi:MAG: PEP-CTERM sorting domain-containing protein, partial [Deltaproteobacteria bacterium]